MSYRCLQLAIVLAFCGQCLVYAYGLGVTCEGINSEYPCDRGFTCTYAGGVKGTKPGVCCRIRPQITDKSVKPIKICDEYVTNPCSLRSECAKKFGEACGGPGSINGVCESHLYCWEAQESSDDIPADGLPKSVGPRNSTCWDWMIAT